MSGYEAVAVIEYQGTLSRAGVSQGHYICDVKDNNTKQWFRTNDNCTPVQIDTSDVSKNAYAVLFKRMWILDKSCTNVSLAWHSK